MTSLLTLGRNRTSPGPEGPVLEVSGLHIGTSHGTELVHGVDLTLHPGRSLGIVGESGSGKTLTALALTALLPRGVVATSGSMKVCGREAFERSRAVRRQLLRENFGVVFQNPTVSLNPRMPIGRQLREALPDDVRRSGTASHRRSIELLEHVGVPRAISRLQAFPHELSGGLNQRIAIAIAIARSPRVLIADEATTALDVSVQKQVLDLIDELRRELDLGLILVSHDIGVIADRSDDVLVMKDGHVVEHGATADVLGSPQDPYTRELLAAVPRLDATGIRERTDERLVLLEATGLVRDFHRGRGHGSVRAVDDVSVTLHQGQALGVVGESGSGKTTLARILVGLDHGHTGELTAFGTPVRDRSLVRRRRVLRDVQYVFQDPYSSLDPRQTVAETIAEPIELGGTREQRAGKRKLVERLLDDVRLSRDFLERKPHQLSGGQRQRVVIARALALGPRVLVADEPVSALDLSVQARILGLLATLRAEHDLTYLVISHDLGVIRQLCTDVVVMRGGRVVERGTTDEIFTNPGHAYTRLLLDAVPGSDWRRGPAQHDPSRK